MNHDSFYLLTKYYTDCPTSEKYISYIEVAWNLNSFQSLLQAARLVRFLGRLIDQKKSSRSFSFFAVEMLKRCIRSRRL